MAADFDVVVVGSGAGGATLTRRLAARGISVCVLERGEDQSIPAAPDPDASGWLTSPADRSNLRAGSAEAPFITEGKALGGATVAYSGNVLRFHPADFRRGSLVGPIAGADLADWPLDYDELEPYYAEMERELGVGGDALANPFEPRRSSRFPMPPRAYDVVGQRFAAAATTRGWHPYRIPTVLTDANGRAACAQCGLCTGYPCTYDARWSARHWLLDARARGTELRLRATVTRVLVAPGGDRARGVEYLDAAGGLHRIDAKVVVLAAGAVQTPRILLQSGDDGAGLANESGMVGRNLMTHGHEPFFVGGYWPDGTETTRTQSCTIAIQDLYDDARAPAPLGLTLEPRAFGAERPWRMVSEQDPARASAGAAYAERFRSNAFVLLMWEDLPCPGNRVSLHPTAKDAQGLAVPSIHHAPHAHDLAFGAFAAEQGERLLEAAGVQDGYRVHWKGPRFHVFGTCRMGDDPSRSVVDADGRAHRLPNLFIADSSVFVTSAGVNPSLTVQAIAARSADQIAAQLARRD